MVKRFMSGSFRFKRSETIIISKDMKRYLDKLKGNSWTAIFRTRHSTYPRLIGIVCEKPVRLQPRHDQQEPMRNAFLNDS